MATVTRASLAEIEKAAVHYKFGFHDPAVSRGQLESPKPYGLTLMVCRLFPLSSWCGYTKKRPYDPKNPAWIKIIVDPTKRRMWNDYIEGSGVDF